jgi:hypothetical protein
MAAPRRQPKVWFKAWFAAALLLSSCVVPIAARAQAPVPMPIPNEVPGQDRKEIPITPNRVDNIKDMFERLFSCWRPPPPSKANPENVTVIVTFDRTGNIFGQPKITYESDQANDNDRLLYRVAVMEALQRCTPMPFTEGMGGAIAGRIIAIPFHNVKPPPKPVEKRVWLRTKTPRKIL